MQQALKFGVSAVTTDGHDVGRLHHVVVDTATGKATAITVERGLIESGNLLRPGGWTKPRDQRVEIAAVLGADEDEVRISPTEEEFLALPPYVIGEQPEPSGGWTPPPAWVAEDVIMRGSSLLGGAVYEPPVDEVENRGPDERHLSGGTAVWRREPHTHLGDLDRVLMDDTSNLVTGFVVRHGVLFPHDTILPVRYVVDLLDDLIHVDIPEAEWETLQEYVVE